MILTQKNFKIFLVIGILFALSVYALAKQKEIILKFATLAPEGTSWMKALNEANRELVSRTGGMVKVKAYPGGVMGDDRTVLRKMRIGQIQIAGLTGLGLADIDHELQVLGIPFLFSNYDEVDHVLAKINDHFETVLEERGYVLLGWSEIGFVYMMSNKPMSSVEAVRGAKVWMPEGDPLSQAVFEKAGVSPVPLAISDVMLALQTGLVDVIYSTPFGAIALQWFTKVKYITEVPLSYSLGAVVMTQKSFVDLPEDHQKTLKRIFRKKLAKLNTEARKENEEALEVMAREGVQHVELPSQELARFQAVARDATEDITGKVFSKGALETVRERLAQFRERKPLPPPRSIEKSPDLP